MFYLQNVHTVITVVIREPYLIGQNVLTCNMCASVFFPDPWKRTCYFGLLETHLKHLHFFLWLVAGGDPIEKEAGWVWHFFGQGDL